jgi:PmbA protein
MPNINEIANSAKETANKLGINKFDIYGSTVDETSVQVDQGEPKQVKASNRLVSPFVFGTKTIQWVSPAPQM